MTQEKKTILQELYKMLMKGQNVENTIERHRKFSDEVRKFVDDADKTDKKKNEFYEDLVYAQKNGVAGLGQAITQCPRDKRLSVSELESVFSELLAKVELDLQSYNDFMAAFYKANEQKGNGTKQPTIYNRVVAAIFPAAVTPIPSEDRFDDVYSWMLENGFLEPDDVSSPTAAESSVDTDADVSDGADQKEKNWYEKNKEVMDAFGKAFDDDEFKNTIRSEDLPSIDEYAMGTFSWRLRDFICATDAPPNLVKYGAPGTGKTFTIESEAKMRFLGWKLRFGGKGVLRFEDTFGFVQFHPSYGYEEFIEGLKPSRENPNVLSLQEGNFKEFCRRAGKWECDLAELGIKGDTTLSDLVGSDKWSNLQDKMRSRDNHWAVLSEDRIIKAKDRGLSIADVLPPFTFVIDEINRAELSRVFGELMYCLEYRGWEKAIRTQYAQLDDKPLLKELVKEKVEGEVLAKFFIPRNIYIVGTMNTIDKSVESFDYALRRRFVWEEVEPDPDVVAGYLKDELKFNDKDVEVILDGINELNEKISGEQLLGPDYRIGHAYFMKARASSYKALKSGKKKKYRDEIWDKYIRHLLFEYLRGTGQEKKVGRQRCLMDELKAKFYYTPETKSQKDKKSGGRRKP